MLSLFFLSCSFTSPFIFSSPTWYGWCRILLVVRKRQKRNMDNFLNIIAIGSLQAPNKWQQNSDKGWIFYPFVFLLWTKLNFHRRQISPVYLELDRVCSLIQCCPFGCWYITCWSVGCLAFYFRGDFAAVPRCCFLHSTAESRAF